MHACRCTPLIGQCVKLRRCSWSILHWHAASCLLPLQPQPARQEYAERPSAAREASEMMPQADPAVQQEQVDVLRRTTDNTGGWGGRVAAGRRAAGLPLGTASQLGSKANAAVEVAAVAAAASPGDCRSCQGGAGLAASAGSGWCSSRLLHASGR